MHSTSSCDNVIQIKMAGKKFNKKVVTLGGGTGQFNLLRGLVKLNKPEYITAIAGSWDSGRSSGKLRTEMGILPPGDERQCLIALMEDPEQQEVALAAFNDRSINNHALGNLIIAVLEKIYHGPDRALDKARKLFLIKGTVAAISLKDLQLNAILQSGQQLNGEEQIDTNGLRTNYNPKDRIARIFFSEKPEPNPQAIKALKEAEIIILPSGSLYGSVLPHLLLESVRKTINSSKAKLVFVLNLMTEDGQTQNYTASDHLETLLYYLGDRKLDYMIVNKKKIDPKILKIYKKEKQEPVEIDEDRCKKLVPQLKIIYKDLASYLPSEHLLRHDPEKLAQAILELDSAN